ncbi:hypothetical protein DFH09DRAFT_1103837 [Mycena vulgaris]|nr:hypothetical protein DFH09DRAFT_1103837 [Mycena vulgaris]
MWAWDVRRILRSFADVGQKPSQPVIPHLGNAISGTVGKIINVGTLGTTFGTKYWRASYYCAATPKATTPSRGINGTMAILIAIPTICAVLVLGILGTVILVLRRRKASNVYLDLFSGVPFLAPRGGGTKLAGAGGDSASIAVPVRRQGGIPEPRLEHERPPPTYFSIYMAA